MSSASHGAAEEADIAQNGAGSNAEKKGHSLEDLRGMIVEGKPNLKELKAALANKPSLLEGTYGGKDGGIDGSGLYPGTHPILHAALRGEKDIFSAIVDAIKTKEGDLRWYLREKDVFGRTVLQLAALGGCWQTFTEVKEACKDESNTTKWEMFTRGDSGGITTLMAAARGGNKKIFKFALNTTRDLLHHAEKKARKFLRRMKPLVTRSTRWAEMKGQLLRVDNQRRTLLQFAALSGSLETFEAVRKACEKEKLYKTEELEMFALGSNSASMTTLMAAVQGGNTDTFQTALSATGDLLESDEAKVKEHVLKRDGQNRTLLQLAAMKGQAMVDAVTAACREWHLTEDEIFAMRRSPVRDSPVRGAPKLMDAIITGKKEKFAAALRAAERKHREREHGESELRAIMTSQNSIGESLLAMAVDSGDVMLFEAVQKSTVDVLSRHEDELRGLVTFKSFFKESLLSKAVDGGNVELFEAVWNFARKTLTHDQLCDLSKSENVFRECLWSKAVARGNVELLDVVRNSTLAVIPHDQVKNHLQSRIENDSELFSTLLMSVIERGDFGLFEAVVECWVGSPESSAHKGSESEGIEAENKDIEADVPGHKALLKEALKSGATSEQHLLSRALSENDEELLTTVIRCALQGHKVAATQNSTMTETFAYCTKWHLQGKHRRVDELKTLSSLLANSAQPSIDSIKKLVQAYEPGNEFKNCCLQAVTSAANPFIPGMTLSVRLAEAAKEVSEGERRTIKDIQTSVHELLLEIFERLPRTVRGFDQFFPKQDTKDQGANPTFQVKNGMDACAAIFEPAPEGEKNEDSNFRGPLEMILSRQKLLKTFCAVPLVMDFLSSKFTLGLPDLSDTGGVLRYPDKLADLNGRMGGEKSGLVLGDGGKALSKIAWFRPRDCSPDPQPDQGLFLKCLENSATMLQAADAGVPNLTFFPGAQFILAGLVAAPDDYFKVPLMRMVLDLVVYIGVLTALGFFVLFPTSNDDFVHRESGWGEGVCATVFVVSGIYREAREMWRDPPRYVRDQWNVLDALGLLFLLIGLIIRWVDSASSWRPAFYALSAPLLVSRVLFFAQILPFQGPMIQVIFRMTTKILKFGFVMVVVMIGFAMALHVLFRGDDRFGETFLALFNAMLGDTDFFEDFSGERHDPVATILLVVYLFIVTIMLLNLLVAILSTSHSKVQDNVKLEFKVSKAHIIDNYQSVVNKDLLPAPFNLVQLVADLIKLVVKLMAMIVGFLPSLSSLPSLSNLCSCRGFRPRDSLFDTVLSSCSKACRSDEFWRDFWRRARRAYGRLVFCAVLGPVAVVGGALLWTLSSAPYAQYAWYTQYKQEKDKEQENDLPFLSRAWRCVLIFFWCFPVAPVRLLVLWVAAFVRVLGSFLRCWVLPWGLEPETSTTPRAKTPTVGSMLRKGPDGVGAEKLREFLEDPMDDTDVRQDEKEKSTTVEHIKFLRNRLESTTKKELNDLRHDVDGLRTDVREMREHLQRVLHFVEMEQ